MMRVSNVVLLVLAASSTTWANPLRSQLRPKVEEATTSRIVGGELSTPGDYPYFVEMGGCGGALIAPDTVLFAAHCGSWQNKQVSVGAYTRQSVAEGAQDRFCDEWVQDPLYGSGNSGINYDFALCKLNEPVTVDASFVSLELNEADSVPSNGEDLIVMGLGTLTAGGSVPDSVHNVTVPYVPNERCTQSDYYGNQVTDIMLCAGFDAGGKDSCQGDSGGPIVKRTYQGNGRFVDTHVGVVSWGEGCAAPKKPGVYARTSKRADWIKSTTCNQFNSVASFCSNTPSPNPPCGGQDLRIRVKTDNYPQEITTNLRRNSGGVLLTRNYLIKNYQNEHKVCLEENTCYTFTIDDSFGDGIPNGNYELVLNGQVIKSGNGNFGSGTTEDFCTGNSAPNPSPVAQPTNPPQPNPTNPPQPNPTNPPQPSPTNPPQPTPNSGACNGNPERQFQLELRTDFYGFETAWGLYEVQGDDIDEDPVCFGTDYEGDTFYTLPSEDEFYCLELGRCYLFEIYDSYGDGMADPAAGYKGILGGVEIFSGDGIFDNDGFVDEQFFCVGDVGTDGPETFPPTFPETFDPSSTDTVEDSFTGTDPADSDPTASPTASPTPSPTPAPTPSPTPAPTPSPTVSTTSGSSSSTTGCSDNPDFRFKDKANKTCKKFLKGKKKNKLRKKCKKKWKGKQVMDWCAETCGTKVGMGRCDFLQSA